MKLTEVIVKRPIAAFTIILGIIVFGVMAVSSMEQESTPSMEMPMMIISASYSGAGPEDVDKLVTTVIEGSIASLSGLDSITSSSSDGRSMVMLQYEYGTDMDTAYLDLKEQLDRISSRLPDDVNTSVMKMSSTSSSNMRLSVTSGSIENLLYYVENELQSEFEKLSTVAEVSVMGGRNEYISVEVMSDKLVQYGLTMSSVASSVGNADFSQPAGEIDYGSQTLSLTSSVSYKTVTELENLPITLNSGGVIRLADVANVYEAEQESSSTSRYNGASTISISITKQQSDSAVSLSKQVKAVVDQINRSGDDVTVEIESDDSETIQESIQSVFETLVMAIVISMIILFVFLGDWRASLIVGSSMPISLMIAFIGMYFMGFTLNIITMSAMVLGVGMMVDNSIVVLDSCFKNHTGGEDYARSAVRGTNTVFLSVMAGTITTVVVFLPLANINGMVGQLFKPLGYTIAFALLASLFASVTLVPLFYTRYQPREKRDAPAALVLKKVERVYGRLLRKILNKKKTVVAVTLALIIASIFLLTGLDMELMSSTDEGRISISIDTRPGLQTEKANDIVLQVEAIVAAHEDVDTYSSNAGSRNSVTAYLKDDRKMTTAEVVEQWRVATSTILNCDITISSESSMTGGMSSDEVSITLTGSDYDALKDFSESVVQLFRQHEDIITVSTTLENGDPQIEIVIDDIKAAAYGLTPSNVASSVNNAMNGISAATITRDGQDYTVKVEYPEGKYTTLTDLTDMILVSGAGRSVPLDEVAKFVFSSAPQSIRKSNNQYSVTVTGTPYSDKKFSAQNDLNAQVNTLQFPDSVSLGTGSMQRMMNEEFSSIYGAIAVAVLLVFMVMTIQFESFKHSIMVMVCLPLCMIGSVGLLSLTGTTLNMTSLLGFLILVGTVVNNGILFVDTTNQYRSSMDLETALVHAARTRLRPIMMTTLTTVLSMIPMALGLGTGSEMTSGLAMVVIGGLTASTVLTLLLLPTFYLMIDGNPVKKARRAEKRQVRLQKRHQKEEEKDLRRRAKFAQSMENPQKKSRRSK